jgi:hypothetical protein
MAMYSPTDGQDRCRPMQSWRISISITVCGLLLLPAAASATTLSEQLFDKSIIIHWTNDRVNRFEGGRIVRLVFDSELTVYVTKSGQAFTRYRVTSGRRGQRSGEAVQRPTDSTTSAGGSLVVHVEGGALLVDTKLMSGARRVAITFDSEYAKCSATVTFGREGGAPIRAKDLISGKRFEVISTRTSSPVCSVKPGNVLGGY